ncbi:MAG: alpha-amylase family glycosyl hydrolase [Acidobacteriota bacterium]
MLTVTLITVPGAAAPKTAAVSRLATGAPALSWEDAVIYFVIVDRFADGDPNNNAAVDTAAKGAFHGGDLKGLRGQLDDIAALGINALWITPVVKNIDGFVTGAGFPDWAYHGYWADDFTRLDPRFGTEEDLKALVDACHSKGIKVLLDVVYNHAGYNSRYLTDPKTKGWFRSNDLGTCGQDDVTSCVAGLPDFKTELPEVDEYLLSAHIGLAKRVGLDGFRLDTVKHVPHEFWNLHRQRTRDALGDGFFLLGEVWGGDPQVLDPWFAGDEMDAGFDFSFQGNVVSFLLGRGRVVAFDRYLKSREKTRAGYHLSQFLSSHDVTGALAQLNGDKDLFRLAAVLELTSVGIPVVYYGEEVGRKGGEWPENRSDMPWGNRPVKPGSAEARDEALRACYQKLIATRRAHPALSRGLHAGVVTAEPNAYVFIRRDAASQDVVVVALNRGTDPVTVKFAVPEEWAQATAVKDILNGEAVAIAAGAMEIPLQPKSARILAVK